MKCETGDKMALDGLLLQQLQKNTEDFLPAKINKIQQISDTEILFLLHSAKGNRKLMISTHSVYNRIHFTLEKYTTLETPGNFVMLLRKLCDQGIIKSLEQVGLDRILHMQIETRDELGDIHLRHMYIELMGKYANMVLVDENQKIIDALKRIPPFENNSRTIHPGAMFCLPAPHIHKQNPYDYETIDLNENFTKQFHGFSPLLATEMQYRILHGETFDHVMQEIQSSSTLYITDIKDTMQFHAIPLKHLETPWRSYEMMKGFDILFYEKEEKVRIKQQSGDLFKTVRKELHKNTSKLPKLKQTLEASMDCDKYREYGDLLFAYLHTIKKEPQVVLPSFETGKDIRIPIDMKYDIKQNANKFYQKYHKSKRAQSIVQEQILLCEKEIEYFEAMEVQLEQASIHDAIEIREELVKQGYLKPQKTKIRKKKKQELPHYETFEFENNTIYVGKNNLQNEYVTWKLGRKEDLWLHAKDYHGAHVVIQGEEISEQVLRDGAMLAAYYSNGRYSSSVPVNYCKIRQLKKIPGNKGSLVSLSNYKTIYIDPEPIHIQELLDQQQ